MSWKRFTAEQVIGILREGQTSGFSGAVAGADQQEGGVCGTDQLLMAEGIRMNFIS